MENKYVYEMLTDIKAKNRIRMCLLYEKLENNDKERMKWIKNKLPWYITKFCRISSNEIILKDTSIFIGVNFGKSARSNCYIELTPRDID